MSAPNRPIFLLASPEPALIAAVEPVFLSTGAHIDVVLTAEAALEKMNGPNPPGIALIDTNLPGMETRKLLTAARAQGSRFPIVLISDNITEEWIERLADGILDDLILRRSNPAYWQFRIDKALHQFRIERELDNLRETASRNAQLDRLTGVCNREAIMTTLFRETDRVQRMKSDLSLVLFDIDDFGHWNSRLGVDACDELLCQAVQRTNRMLRSYDVLGRPGMDEFLLVLPGCMPANAATMAERLRTEVFATPFQVVGEAVRLSACFGVASSQGHSPVVVLREAEQALQWAKSAGPESIQCFGLSPHPTHAPVAFLSPTTGDELLAW